MSNMAGSETLFRRDIIEDARHPRHFGALVGARYVLNAANPTCGDEMTLYIKLENTKSKDPKIAEVSFTGSGCMVMMASASRFTHALHGKTLAAAARITESQALKIFGALLTPSRETCALMPWRALQNITKSKNQRSKRQSKID